MNPDAYIDALIDSLTHQMQSDHEWSVECEQTAGTQFSLTLLLLRAIRTDQDCVVADTHSRSLAIVWSLPAWEIEYIVDAAVKKSFFATVRAILSGYDLQRADLSASVRSVYEASKKLIVYLYLKSVIGSSLAEEVPAMRALAQATQFGAPSTMFSRSVLVQLESEQLLSPLQSQLAKAHFCEVATRHIDKETATLVNPELLEARQILDATIKGDYAV